MGNSPSIVDLPERIAALPAACHARFKRLFRVDRVTGDCLVPDTMRAWVEAQFGSLDAVMRQHVVRVTNLVTFDGALYNPLRRWRPQELSAAKLFTTQTVDRFADPLRHTPEDPFGRVRGQRCITASNIARWEGLCAVLIFDQPDPLAFTQAALRDYLRTSLAWAQRAHQHDPEARYFIWIWNGGPKGGASIPHAHAQLALGRGMHYARVEWLRRAALAYLERYRVNFFDDLLAAHEDVGLGFQVGRLRGFFYLAANRPKDTWIYGRAMDDDLADALYAVLHGLVTRADMRAFNVAILMPPLFPADDGENWRGFPVIARVGDRGLPDAISADIGALDLYAHNTIAEDPFEVMTRWQSKE
jgi:hypothetical protein